MSQVSIGQPQNNSSSWIYTSYCYTQLIWTERTEHRSTIVKLAKATRNEFVPIIAPLITLPFFQPPNPLFSTNPFIYYSLVCHTLVFYRELSILLLINKLGKWRISESFKKSKSHIAVTLNMSYKYCIANEDNKCIHLWKSSFSLIHQCLQSPHFQKTNCDT